MTKEKLEELGWQFDDFWNNRALFSKKDRILNGFAIFEHSGDWGIMDPYANGFELIYCNMSDDEITQYVNYVNIFEEINKNPKEHNFYEYICNKKNMKDFVKNMKDKS